jgi:hypothetical protein
MIFLLLLFVVTNALCESNAPFVLDEIKVVIYAQHGTEIITQSDLERPVLGGSGPQSLDELIFECRVFLDALEHKILPDDEMVDRYLNNIQRENNLSDSDMAAIFSAAGFTVQQAREHLGRMQMINNMLDFEIRSNLIVPKQAVIDYWHANPVVQEAEYTVMHAMIPFDPCLTAARQLKNIKHMLRAAKDSALVWSVPFTVKLSEVADDKYFIAQLQTKQVGIIKTKHGFELYKMVAVVPECFVSLEDRYDEIMNILRKPVYDALMEQYKKRLFDTVSIIYF